MYVPELHIELEEEEKLLSRGRDHLLGAWVAT